MSEYVLELKDITKIFPGVKALDQVRFQLKKGEIHALMGENGAGKSTFIKVITGVHRAEEGEMYLNGSKVHFKGPKDAQKAGIAAIYQHVTAYPHLTVAENIFIGHEKMKHEKPFFFHTYKTVITDNDMIEKADAKQFPGFINSSCYHYIFSRVVRYHSRHIHEAARYC